MIRPISQPEVKGFIDCYIQVFKTLYEFLPEEYVTNQINEASTQEFHQKVLEILKNSNNILLISLQNQEITGIAWGYIKGDAGWLSFMGVKLQYRGIGIGRSILNHFMDELKGRGACKISLNTDPSLVPAIALYESEGFKREGTVMSTHGLELIIYSKNLVDDIS